MAWYTPFIIPAILNTPQLLRSGNVGQFVQNTGVQGATNTAIGNIAPNFNMNPTPSYVPGFNPPMASNVGSLLTDSTGSLGNVASAAYTGPTSMMAQNLARPTDVITPLPENTFQFDAGLANAADVQKYPDYSITKDKLGRSLEYTGGGAEVAEKPFTTKVFEKITDYVKEKPFEAAMLGMMGGGAIYEGLKGPERPAPQPTLGPKLGGGQVNMGAPLQVFRQRRRGR